MAQIAGIQREERFRYRDLRREVQNMHHISRVIAPLGIIGRPGSGKKTLAYRFSHINEGAFHEEIPIQSVYTAYWEEDFPDEFRHRRHVVLLIIYIINEPLSVSPGPGHEYYADWNNFCCLLILFDVMDRSSHIHASYNVTAFRMLGKFNIMLVGNHCDRRSQLQEPGREEVPRRIIEEEADEDEVNYYECSALMNIDVEPLLMDIKQQAVAPKYWIRSSFQ